MSLEKWVDLSKWQRDVPDASLRAMKADSVVGICVGSWHGIDANPFVESVLRRARAIGLKTATYVIMNGRPGAWTVQQGKAACGAEWPHLTFVAPDVEVQGVTEAILRDAFAEVGREGHRNLMYTGNWFWNWWALSIGHFPDVGSPDTWLADYDGVPALDTTMRPGYGPQRAKQIHGSRQMYGTTVDGNVFDSDWISAWPEAPEPPTPEPPEEEEIMGRIADSMHATGLEIERQMAAATKGATGPRGLQGPEGDTGPMGPPGPAGDGSTARYDILLASDLHATGFAARNGISFAKLQELNPAGPPSGNWNIVHAGESYRVA